MTEPSNNTSTQQAVDREDDTQLAKFEASLGELETLVEALEAGNISLEDALAKFERGVILTRQCRNLLQKAELRVDQLLEDGETVAPVSRTTPADGTDSSE